MTKKLCPNCKSDRGKGRAHRALCPSLRTEQPLPAPFSWDDLCDCGKERSEHSGKYGNGSSSDCPRFKDCEL